MKSKIVQAWVGQVVRIEQDGAIYEGVLKEAGTCWVVIELTWQRDRDTYMRLRSDATIEVRTPEDLEAEARWEEERRRQMARQQQLRERGWK